MLIEIIAVCLLLFGLYTLLSNIWSVSDLQSRPVLVTGCDTGFGHLLAVRLVKHGFPTFAGCLTEKGETELRKACADGPGKLVTFSLDVTKDESVKAAYEKVTKELGPGKGLWGLVNNAGIAGDSGPLDWLNVEHYRRTIEVNCFGVIRVTTAFKELVKKSKGRVVIITSIFGRLPLPGLAPYCVSKFAAEAFADVLRVEIKFWGVSVHTIEPSVHATNMTDPKAATACVTRLWNSLSDEKREEYGEEYLKRCSECLADAFDPNSGGDPERVVDAYYHALTSRLPKIRYVVGREAVWKFHPLSLLPSWVSDTAMHLTLKARNVPVPKMLQKA